jgi:glyoxylase I family protein
MIKQLSHTCILTDDLELSEHFYTKILGLKKKFNFLKNKKIVGFYLDAGNSTYVEVVKTNRKLNQATFKLQHFCFEVQDIDAAIKSIRENGWEIGDKYIGHDQTPHALLKDPNGVQLELHEYSAASSQINGKDVEVDW